MAEGLFMKSDKTTFEPGDAVCFRPDGFEWGPGELNQDMFIIIRIPDINHTSATEYFCANEKADPTFIPNPKKRVVKLDLEKLIFSKNEKLDKIVVMSLDEVEQGRIKKPPTKKDPFVIGKDPFIIG